MPLYVSDFLLTAISRQFIGMKEGAYPKYYAHRNTVDTYRPFHVTSRALHVSLIRWFGVQLPHTNTQSAHELKLFFSSLDTDGLYLQVCSLSLVATHYIECIC